MLGQVEVAKLDRDDIDLTDQKRANRASYQLYDLSVDPNETLDLADDNPGVFAELRNNLRAIQQLAAISSAQEGEPVELDQKTIDGLRAIGYLP